MRLHGSRQLVSHQHHQELGPYATPGASIDLSYVPFPHPYIRWASLRNRKCQIPIAGTVFHLCEYFSLVQFMAPHYSTIVNETIVDGLVHTQSSSSMSNETIINLIFGLCALILGLVTIWQAHLARRRRLAAHHNPAYELEGTLGPHSESSPLLT